VYIYYKRAYRNNVYLVNPPPELPKKVVLPAQRRSSSSLIARVYYNIATFNLGTIPTRMQEPYTGLTARSYYVIQLSQSVEAS